VVDNLTTGRLSLVPEQADFIHGNIGDQALLRDAIRKFSVTAIIHFAGSAIVPDSVETPLAYYENNTSASRNLIETCVQEGVKNLIFSSTAAVYGVPEHTPVTEDEVTAPINPYGRSKLVTEWILEDTCRAHELHALALRYFNVAGADPRGRTGQSTPRATHLIKRACQAALDRIPVLDIFGTDFPTHDGTGVRDYIHVSDLVSAHLLGLEHLEKGGASLVMNCGYGHGFSVREIIATVGKIAGREIPTREAPRRPGDPAELVADSTRLKSVLGWQPRYDDIEEIAATAYRWEKRLNAA
jgi:UDP-glucose 4-epimerase